MSFFHKKSTQMPRPMAAIAILNIDSLISNNEVTLTLKTDHNIDVHIDGKTRGCLTPGETWVVKIPIVKRLLS